MMTNAAGRTGDNCPECGTPLELTETVAEGEDTASGEGGVAPVVQIVFRCANGHTVVVTRHETTTESEETVE